MSRAMTTFSSSPEKELIRQREVIQWLGVTAHELQILVELGILHRVHLRPNSYGWFKTEEIRRLILSQSTLPPDYGSSPRTNSAPCSASRLPTR
jgi:hypothetical protein